jgi:carboxyl-terminal processing protease
VTRVGRPTLGIFSDDLAKHLPNGWVTSLSNEVYAAPDGNEYEGEGVPPQVHVPVFREHDFRGGLELAVARAVELANGARL